MRREYLDSEGSPLLHGLIFALFLLSVNSPHFLPLLKTTGRKRVKNLEMEKHICKAYFLPRLHLFFVLSFVDLFEFVSQIFSSLRNHSNFVIFLDKYFFKIHQEGTFDFFIHRFSMVNS